MGVNITEYTTTSLGTAALAGTDYRVEAQVEDATGRVVQTWLYGPRGGVYFLRPYLNKRGDDGLRQVISWVSGQPLRRGGREVRAVILGNIVEEYKPSPRDTGSTR